MKQYFYVGQNGSQCGPVEMGTLKSLGITRETLVWCDGMVNWTKAGDVPDLASIFAGVPPAIPAAPQVAPPVVPHVAQEEKQSHRSYASIPPDNHLVWAILATIFCCLPFGIVAIVKANQVESRWAMGDKMGAHESANSAANWCWASFACALIVFVFYFCMGFFGIM